MTRIPNIFDFYHLPAGTLHCFVFDKIPQLPNQFSAGETAFLRRSWILLNFKLIVSSDLCMQSVYLLVYRKRIHKCLSCAGQETNHLISLYDLDRNGMEFEAMHAINKPADAFIRFHRNDYHFQLYYRTCVSGGAADAVDTANDDHKHVMR